MFLLATVLVFTLQVVVAAPFPMDEPDPIDPKEKAFWEALKTAQASKKALVASMKNNYFHEVTNKDIDDNIRNTAHHPELGASGSRGKNKKERKPESSTPPPPAKQQKKN